MADKTTPGSRPGAGKTTQSSRAKTSASKATKAKAGKATASGRQSATTDNQQPQATVRRNNVNPLRKKVERAFGLKPKAINQEERQSSEQLFAGLTRDLLAEKRARRRWGIFFKLATLAIVVTILAQIANSESTSEMFTHGMLNGEQLNQPFVAVVEIKGIIADGGEVQADRVIRNLRRAMEHANSKAVLLDINSPGGSPVQAASIYREMMRLRELYPEIPLYAVISDLGASGGYYIAVGAQQIYADPSSIIGSIGVIFSGFGFTGAMEKLGVDRRLLTAGDNKALLDPFSPRSLEEEAHMQSMLNNIHRQFIEDVLTSRPKLRAANRRIFSGLVFDGRQALHEGLIDGLGDRYSVAREQVGVEELVVFDDSEDEWFNLLQHFTGALARSLVAAVTRATGLQATWPAD